METIINFHKETNHQKGTNTMECLKFHMMQVYSIYEMDIRQLTSFENIDKPLSPLIPYLFMVKALPNN